MVFTIISTFYFFKDSYSHMIRLQVLIQLTTWSYWMQIMSPKSSNLYHVIYLKEKNGWIVNHIHLHLFPMYQTNHQVPLIIFHPSMDRFYIIGNLGFGQVYILDLPLLLTWNSYLKLFIINLYSASQKIFLVRPMRFIILFPIFIHTITPILILLFVITSSYFIVTKPWAIFFQLFFLLVIIIMPL
jgi:hypothetical protein